MLGPRLLRMISASRAVEGHKRRSAGNDCPLNVSCDMDVMVTSFTSTSLCSICPPMTCETRWFWLSSPINCEARLPRQKVVVEWVLLGDRVAVDGVAVIRPIGEIGPNLALARAVVQVAVLDGLRTAHLVDADIAVDDGAASQREVQPHGAA